MARYHGGEKVKGGLYWNPARWEILPLPKGGGVLPGEHEARYIRLPLLMMMVVGPFMGALFVMFLPVIGFVLLLGFGGMKLVALGRRAVTNFSAEAVAVADKDD